MQSLFSLRWLTASLALALAPLAPAQTADSATGRELAAQLRERQQSGSIYTRARFEGVTGANPALQVQIKSRAGKSVVYQILWPKERKGESVLLRRGGSAVTFVPPQQMGSVALREPLFGSALAWEDVIEDPYSWEQQTVTGAETINRVPCAILESKPAPGQSTSYSLVRTWVDKRRLVPMQIEKLGANGKVLRSIQASRIVNDDTGKPVPATLTVRGPGGQVTAVEGGKIRHGITFADAEFTPDGLKETVIPKGSPE